MSKIGDYNLILQEQAEELGFSTTQEALDNDFVVVEKQNGKPYLTRLYDAELEQEEAHEAWLKERDELLRRLEKKQDKLKKMLCDDTGLYNLIADAIKFIKEQCHD